MEKYFDSRLSPEFRQGAAAVWRVVAEHILSYLPAPSDTILDLGAGYGDFINQVAAKEKWAVDLWPGFLAGLAPNIRGVIGDIRKSQATIPAEHFSLCFMSNVLEHFTVEEGEQILQHVRGYLSANGHLVLLQPNFAYCSKNYFDDYTHKTIYTHEGLTNLLLDNGFQIVSCMPRYLPFSFKSRAPRAPWIVWLYLRMPWKPFAAQVLLVAKKK